MAKHLTSLKRKHSESGAVEEDQEDFFPHSLFLDEEDIEKLGVGHLELGDERQMVAEVKVTSISSSESDEDGKRRSMKLVITEGDIMSGKSRSARIFGGDDGGK